MKLKLVSAACLALCSFGSFAATVSSCPATPTAADLVNKCAPEVTFYMGGASAQAPALTAVLTSTTGLFDAAKPFVKVRDTALTISGSGGATALAAGKDGNTIAFVGYGATGTAAAGKRLAVIYNKANGSFAGVNQLFNPKTVEAENTTLVLTTAAEQKTAGGKVAACTLAADSLAATTTTMAAAIYECSSEAKFSSAWGVDKSKAMSLALADVRPSEATPGLYAGVIAKWKASAFPSVTTAMQGFGVIVSPNLYTALIAKEVAAGHLASSCLTSETVGAATDVITAACQPNLSTAAYTSLITGKTLTANDFLGTTGDTNLIVLARRTDSSGTQASSNIFFANQAGTAAKAALQATDNAPDVIHGNLTDPTASVSYGDVRVYEKTGTGDVISAVSAPAAGTYALGVVSLENTYSMTKSASKLKGAQFVKIDGISPSLTEVAGATVVDSKARVGIMAGYPYAFAMQALTSAKLAEPYLSVAGKIVTALQDPAANLAGLAYIGSTDAGKNTPFTRLNSNYAPLSK
jgi:hypothetical protein